MRVVSRLFLVVLLISALISADVALSGQAKQKRKPSNSQAGPRPDLENVSYGPNERLKLDLWKAKSDQPTPILVFFHGGSGNKLQFRGNQILAFCLDHGISAAVVNYRTNRQHQVTFSVSAHDVARAIQFLRYHAAEYHLDPKRVAADGTSLGANTSTWLAYHDDLADPQNADPVLRESTRLSFMITHVGQTFIDMELHQRLYPYKLPAKLAADAEARAEERSGAMAKEMSAIYHVTQDDPPIFMTYPFPLKPLPLPQDTPYDELVHNPAFGMLFKEKLDAVGIENYFYHGGNKPPPGAVEKFILAHFFPQPAGN